MPGSQRSNAEDSNGEARDDDDRPTLHRKKQPPLINLGNSQEDPSATTEWGQSSLPRSPAEVVWSTSRNASCSSQLPQTKPSNIGKAETSSLDVLRSEKQRLEKRLEELGTRFEMLQREMAFEKSNFLMERCQLLVEIEGLREDRAFLRKKRDDLSAKVLERHMARVNLDRDSERTKTHIQGPRTAESTKRK